MNPLDRSIDLLVDGELDDEARRILLEQLDLQPDGWRRCALAFLEAQTWRSAVKIATKPAANPIFLPLKPPRKRTAAGWLARAACVLIVFAIGWAAGRNPGGLRSEDVVKASQPIEAKPIDRAASSPPSPGYLQAKLEREGFKIEQRVVIVPGRTPSGQRVGVPIEQTKVRFVGNRSI